MSREPVAPPSGAGREAWFPADLPLSRALSAGVLSGVLASGTSATMHEPLFLGDRRKGHRLNFRGGVIFPAPLLTRWNFE